MLKNKLYHVYIYDIHDTFICTVCYMMVSSLVQRITTAVFFFGEFHQSDCLSDQCTESIFVDICIYVWVYYTGCNTIVFTNFQHSSGGGGGQTGPL
jgi:hypothetical protein